MLFFFFKQKAAYEMRISDWSSDVCSSDLCAVRRLRLDRGRSENPDAEGAQRRSHADADRFRRSAGRRRRSGVPERSTRPQAWLGRRALGDWSMEDRTSVV